MIGNGSHNYSVTTGTLHRYSIPILTGIILLVISGFVSAQEPDSHDIYDLRVGVERYYSSCVPLPGVISCGQAYYTYRMERVIGYTALDEQEYAKIERILISNERMIIARDTLYQRVEDNTLFHRWESEQGPEEVAIYHFDFVPGDSVTYYIRNFEVENDPYYQDVHNLSVITADTTVTFPDGEPYRVVYGSDDTYPWDNARLGEELSADWSNTVIREGTLGSNITGLNWLVPFANMKGPEDNFLVGIHSFYHVSRFGPILSMAYTGWRYLAGFKGHDGQIYGYFHDGIPGAPSSIDRNGKEGAVGFRLLGNYPNPFNPGTSIRYQLSETSEVRLEVVNIFGQQVALPMSHEVQPAGIHDAAFDASGLSSGVYFYRMVVRPAGTGNIKTGISTGKMTLIK